MNGDTSRNDGFLLHGSGVRTPKGALLFLGPSGVGKSTICELLSPEFPTIADDCLYISRNKQNRWTAANGRFHMWTLRRERGIAPPSIAGAEPCGTPILAIMLLSQYTHNLIEPLDGQALCAMITNAVIEISGQSQSYNAIRVLRWFELAAQVARSVPGSRLRFAKTRDVLRSLDDFVRVAKINDKNTRSKGCAQ